MTQERKHELNKLLADVAGKSVHEDMVEVNIDLGSATTREWAWVDDHQVLWDPIDDANDVMVVQEALIKNYDCEITCGWRYGGNCWFTELAFRSPKKIITKRDSDPSNLVAFALAVEQWWKERKEHGS